MQMLVKKQLISNTNLMIRMLETQLVQRLVIGIYSRKIEVDSIKDLVICNTALYDIVRFMFLSFSTSRNKIEPSVIVCFKYDIVESRQSIIQLIYIKERLFAFTQKTLTIFFGLLTQ